MGKEICPICGQPIKMFSKVACKDDIVICRDCALRTEMNDAWIRLQSIDSIKECLLFRERNFEIFSSFNITKEVKAGSIGCKWIFRADEEKRLWYYTLSKNPKSALVLRYDEIADYELVENGETVSKGGLGSAVAGGLLFGDVGAVVGGITGKKKGEQIITSMCIRASLSNKYVNTLTFYIMPAGTKAKTDSILYQSYKKEANDVISFFDSLVHQAQKDMHQQLVNNAHTNAAQSVADEILKFKNLMDQGIITTEEFEAKKRQLLNL